MSIGQSERELIDKQIQDKSLELERSKRIRMKVKAEENVERLAYEKKLVKEIEDLLERRRNLQK